MDVNKDGQISFDELCLHFLPQRPVMPSPLHSPRVARDRTCPEADGSLQASPGGVGGGKAEKISAAKPVATLRDEDFAQLLDEIEADRDEFPVAPHNTLADSDLLGTAAVIGDSADREASVASLLASSDLGADMLEESLPLEDSTALLLSTMEAPTAPSPTPADVDEELSRMLADLNGP